MDNYQIGSDISQSSQIIRKLSELQRWIKQIKIVTLLPKCPLKDQTVSYVSSSGCLFSSTCPFGKGTPSQQTSLACLRPVQQLQNFEHDCDIYHKNYVQEFFSNVHQFWSIYIQFQVPSYFISHFSQFESFTDIKQRHLQAFTAISNNFPSFLEQFLKLKNKVVQDFFFSIYVGHQLGFCAHSDVLWDAGTSLKPKSLSELIVPPKRLNKKIFF